MAFQERISSISSAAGIFQSTSSGNLPALPMFCVLRQRRAHRINEDAHRAVLLGAVEQLVRSFASRLRSIILLKGKGNGLNGSVRIEVHLVEADRATMKGSVVYIAAAVVEQVPLTIELNSGCVGGSIVYGFGNSAHKCGIDAM